VKKIGCTGDLQVIFIDGFSILNMFIIHAWIKLGMHVGNLLLSNW